MRPIKNKDRVWNSSTEFCKSLHYQSLRISVQLKPCWYVRTDSQSDGEMDWHDVSNGRSSRMRRLVKTTRQSVEIFTHGMFTAPTSFPFTVVSCFQCGPRSTYACGVSAFRRSAFEYFTLLGCYWAYVGICLLKFWYDIYGTYRLPLNVGSQQLTHAT